MIMTLFLQHKVLSTNVDWSRMFDYAFEWDKIISYLKCLTAFVCNTVYLD